MHGLGEIRAMNRRPHATASHANAAAEIAGLRARVRELEAAHAVAVQNNLDTTVQLRIATCVIARISAAASARPGSKSRGILVADNYRMDLIRKILAG